MRTARELWALFNYLEAHLTLLLLLPFVVALTSLLSARIRTRAPRFVGRGIVEHRFGSEGSDSRQRAPARAEEANHK